MRRSVFALVDCNNFFVSCERVFRPDLMDKPVVVLSSNDGVVVARSNEAKDLGVPMGAPAFKYSDLMNRHNVVRFSGNFELYGNMSRRITELLTTITPRIEVYSVDESFLDLAELPLRGYAEWGQNLHQAIRRWTGIPVSVGIAATKTLAKLAAAIAKHDETYDGSMNLYDIPRQKREKALTATPVQEIWGVGRRLAPRLRAEGISSALDLAAMRPKRAMQLMGVNGSRLVSELNGIACHSLETENRAAESIMRSRTFGEDTGRIYVLEAAVASLAARAAFALRRDGLLARRIGFFTDTNRNKPGYRRWSRERRLNQPTNDTGLIISLLVRELAAVFSSGQKYHRLGVYLDDFVPENTLQIDLLGHVSPVAHDKSQARMQALDRINEKFGKNKLHYAAEHLSQAWQPKHHIRSPRYVSHWKEIPRVRIIG